MSLFFIDILAYSLEISKGKALGLLTANLIVIIITLFRYFVHGQLFAFIGMINEDLVGIFYISSANLTISRLIRYLS